jgi:hypothetical protein
MASAEQALISNAVETGRQQVERKATDELPAASVMVFCASAVRVAPDAADDLLWPRKRPLGAARRGLSVSQVTSGILVMALRELPPGPRKAPSEYGRSARTLFPYARMQPSGSRVAALRTRTTPRSPSCAA